LAILPEFDSISFLQIDGKDEHLILFLRFENKLSFINFSFFELVSDWSAFFCSSKTSSIIDFNFSLKIIK
jgi:hypothetical protein